MKKYSKSRREFLKKGIQAGLTLPLIGYPIASSAQDISKAPSKNKSIQGKALEILILGGTGFLGPHMVAEALGRGHNVSIFNRGRTKPTIHTELFKDVKHFKGFRESDLSSLEGHKWDAVIDNSGNHQDWTRESAKLLKDNVGMYLYTSSTGVYFPYIGSDISEETELVTKVPENINSFQAVEYGFGVMKALSEIEAKKEFGKDRTTIVRATYLMGPADRSDRFTYWPERLSKGGKVLVPGMKNDPVQFIDARDISSFMIHLIEKSITGTMNAIGPASTMGMQEFIHGVSASFSVPTTYEFIDDHDFLTDNNLMDQVPWIIPTGENYGSARVNGDLAITNGLTLTPLSDSIRDIHEWWHGEAVTDVRRGRLLSGPNSLMSKEESLFKLWEDYKKA